MELDHVAKLEDGPLRLQDLPDKMQVLQTNQRGVDGVLEDLLGLRHWLLHVSLRARLGRILGLLHLWKLNIDDSGVEDVNEVFVLVDILIDAVNVEVLVHLLGELLEGEEMLEDDTARLEQIVGEALLSISWLQNAKTGRVPETRVEPAADHEVSEHVYLLAVELRLVPGLVLPEATRVELCRGGNCLRLHDQDLHHGSERVWHQICADDETLEDLMHDALADLCQILVHLTLRVTSSLVRWVAAIENLPLQIKELLTVKSNLKALLSWIAVLINHQVFQH